MTYIKKTITQVKKAIREKGEWSGLLVPNKVNHFHFLNGWCLGRQVILPNEQILEQTVNGMLAHMESELGNRVAFYEIEFTKLE
jgi:hypothetical protein